MTPPPPTLKATIGSPPNTWHHSSSTGFDLRRTATPSPPSLTLSTTTSPITITPSTSALVIIDMQNFFLSPSLGRSVASTAHAACKRLIEEAIPAARRAGMRVLWVNWGIEEEEVEGLPAGVTRAFGFTAVSDAGEGVGVDKHGVITGGVYKGIGTEMGTITLSENESGDGEDGKQVDAGRLLIRGSWNADLYSPLKKAYEAGAALPSRPDLWIHKNRMSALWGATTPLQQVLEREGITTLFFAGVNTDQCVGGTLTEAFSRGYDCVLLSDGSATSSPAFAQECWEYNAAQTFGFCCSCGDLARGVAGSQ